MRNAITVIILLMLSLQTPTFGREADATNTFTPGKGTFLLDGKPYVIKAAELHYPRIPKPYWDHRIKLCKALGMNTICLYTFWNIHEPAPDEFDFTDGNDLREFVELCRDNGMKVILRPGPYVCAEWEMGGLPWWLLNKEDIRLRELDPYFMERVEKFQKAVADRVADLTIDKGGPIIMVQVENEYGSYGTDKEYVAAIRDILRRNFGNEVTLFQCDWSSNFLENGLDDLVWTMNFGTGADIESEFRPLLEVRPDSPLMCSEFWSGWFDKWGASHETRPAEDMIAGIDEMLSKGISFSLYMTHGGTNPGHWAGANSPGYAPDVTSYDYDAPISECGLPTPKFFLLRETMAKYADGDSLPTVPPPFPTDSIAPIRFSEIAPLFDNLPEARRDSAIRSMEHYNMGFGSIMYRTLFPQSVEAGVLTVEEPHDFAQVLINGNLVGTLDRRLGKTQLTMPPIAEGDTLDILVEATGRINFGRAIKDYKGITSKVSLSAKSNGKDNLFEPAEWQVFCMEDAPSYYSSMQFQPLSNYSPDSRGRLPRGLYRATFTLDRTADTFLNFETWGKGLVFVNGHPLGRIWQIGPQQTLYTPGCYLNEGENEILVFDILGPEMAVTEGLTRPVLDKLNLPQESSRAEKPTLDTSLLSPDYEGSFPGGFAWQQADFSSPLRGRYLCFEITDADTDAVPKSIAEINLLDADGVRIPREDWRVLFADSEQLDGNHTAEKMFDLQESTYWTNELGARQLRFIIDLGRICDLSAIQYLPHRDKGEEGCVRNFSIFCSAENFTAP